MDTLDWRNGSNTFGAIAFALFLENLDFFLLADAAGNKRSSMSRPSNPE